MEHTFSNGIRVAVDEKTGKLVLARTTRIAQVTTPLNTMPKDVVEEQDRVDQGETRLEIPRDESVGLKQTEPTEVTVYQYDYELGDNGSDESIVPRDPSGDGVGGEKVTFEPELADGYSSGNPDDYIQTLQDREMPTPAGDAKNRATVAKSELEKKLAEKEKEALDAKREAQTAKLKLERERYARKIVQAEIERGLCSCNSDSEVEERVAIMSEDTPVKYLARELERVQLYPKVPTAATTENNEKIATANRIKSGFDSFQGLQTGAWRVPHMYNSETQMNVTPVTINDKPNFVNKLSRAFSLGDKYSDESIREYEQYRKSK